MLKSRFLSAMVLLPLAFGAIYVGDWAYIALVTCSAMISGWDYVHIANQAGHQVRVISVWLFIFAWVYWAITQQTDLLPLLLVLLILLSAFWEIIGPQHVPSFCAWVYGVSAGMYLGATFAYLLVLRLQADGLYWTLISLPVIWVGDTAAFFVGRKLGRHTWFPTISPGKTWEGYFAQIIAGTFAGTCFTYLMSIWIAGPATMNLGMGALLGFILSVFCPFGDLFISLLKREFQVKDTSHMIPGHGGVLDRLDALLWAGALTQLFISLLH